MEKGPGKEAMDLYDKYSRGLLDRREFLKLIFDSCKKIV
jgi:hypothetical protein